MTLLEYIYSPVGNHIGVLSAIKQNHASLYTHIYIYIVKECCSLLYWTCSRTTQRCVQSHICVFAAINVRSLFYFSRAACLSSHIWSPRHHQSPPRQLHSPHHMHQHTICQYGLEFHIWKQSGNKRHAWFVRQNNKAHITAPNISYRFTFWSKWFYSEF